MAVGKWCMYLGALLFLIIGLGSLAVAVVPGADEWAAETFLDTFSPSTSSFNDEAAEIVDDSDLDTVRTTSLFLAVTFLPCAALFIYIGRWFTSMQTSVDSMMQTNASAVYQQYGGGVVTGSPWPTGQAPGTPPVTQPPPG